MRYAIANASEPKLFVLRFFQKSNRIPISSCKQNVKNDLRAHSCAPLLIIDVWQILFELVGILAVIAHLFHYVRLCHNVA